MSKNIKYSFTKYKKRDVIFFKIMQNDNWNIKVYGINLDNLPNESIMGYLQNELPTPALTEFRYGMGFLIIHKGIVANWFLLNWWGFEDIVHQKLFKSPVESFNEIEPVEDNSILACIHELDMYSFESVAWRKHVLSSKKPDFERYLKTIYY